MISDFDVPEFKGEIGTPTAGIKAIGEVGESVDQWNAAHPDEDPVTLKVYVNSTYGTDPEYQQYLNDTLASHHQIIGSMDSQAKGRSKASSIELISDILKKNE